jgi:hypothetical protein
MALATFWATFSQTHLVTLLSARHWVSWRFLRKFFWGKILILRFWGQLISFGFSTLTGMHKDWTARYFTDWYFYRWIFCQRPFFFRLDALTWEVGLSQAVSQWGTRSSEWNKCLLKNWTYVCTMMGVM